MSIPSEKVADIATQLNEIASTISIAEARTSMLREALDTARATASLPWSAHESPITEAVYALSALSLHVENLRREVRWREEMLEIYRRPPVLVYGDPLRVEPA